MNEPRPTRNRLILAYPLCAALLLSFLPECRSAEDVPTVKMLEGKRYELTFHDEFDGQSLDKTKWQHRLNGLSPAFSWAFTNSASWLDGKGNLVMAMFTIPKAEAPYPQDSLARFPGKWLPFSNMLRTKDEFTFGYHEVRLIMPVVRGAGMAVWMQSRGQTQKPPSPDPKVGSEIDLIEQTFFDKYGRPCDFKHATIHWGGYADTHQWVSITTAPLASKRSDKDGQDSELNLVKKENAAKELIHRKMTYSSDNLNFRDGKYHTVAVLWTKEFYKFYYDGECIGTITDGVSWSPGYMILSPRLFDFEKHAANSAEGFGNLDNTTAKYVIDYYRVYQAK